MTICIDNEALYVGFLLYTRALLGLTDTRNGSLDMTSLPGP
jgi:hypothetical protein